VGDRPRGARFDRYVEFSLPDGAACVQARTVWAIIDKAKGRVVRVPPEVVAPFVEER
jgi:acyl-CoA thioester hydrolase